MGKKFRPNLPSPETWFSTFASKSASFLQAQRPLHPTKSIQINSNKNGIFCSVTEGNFQAPMWKAWKLASK